MRFLVFRKQDGLLVRTGSCPDRAVGLQASEGEIVVPWDASVKDPLEWTWQNGSLVGPSDDRLL